MPDSTREMACYPLLESLLAQKKLPAKGIYTNKDVAEIFGVGVRTIQDWCSDGRLVSRNLPGRGRCLSEDLEAFLRDSLKGRGTPEDHIVSSGENARGRSQHSGRQRQRRRNSN